MLQSWCVRTGLRVRAFTVPTLALGARGMGIRSLVENIGIATGSSRMATHSGSVPDMGRKRTFTVAGTASGILAEKIAA